MSWVRVTVKDLETGEEETVEIKDDYILVAVGECYLNHSQVYATGTHILTVKNSNGEKRESTVGKCKTCGKARKGHKGDGREVDSFRAWDAEDNHIYEEV